MKIYLKNECGTITFYNNEFNFEIDLCFTDKDAFDKTDIIAKFIKLKDLTKTDILFISI